MTPMIERSSPFESSGVRPSSPIFSTTASTCAGSAWWDMTMITGRSLDVQLPGCSVEVRANRLRPTQVGGLHLGLGPVGVVEEKDTDAHGYRPGIRPRNHHVVAAEEGYPDPAHPPRREGGELGIQVQGGREVAEADLVAVELVQPDELGQELGRRLHDR